MLLDVINVQTVTNYTLRIEFENGEFRLFDMSPFMDNKPFDRLKDINQFNRVKVKYGTLLWPGNIDIAPETLYEQSKPIN